MSGTVWPQVVLTDVNGVPYDSTTPSPVGGPAVGIVTETAPANDTASSGLNGRLQRIAQRITSMIASTLFTTPHIALVSLSATLTRTNDANAYAAGDIVSTGIATEGLLQFLNAVPTAAGTGIVRAATMEKSGSGTTNATFRLHLFAADPAGVVGNDNAVLTYAFGDRNTRIGTITFGTAIGGANLTVVFYNGVVDRDGGLHFVLPSGTTIYGALEVTGAYTPANSESFEIKLFIEQGP